MVACRRSTSLLHSTLVLSSLVAAACGGGGGGAAAKPVAAAVTATFPAVRCVTDSRKLTLRGTTADPKRIQSLEVDGIPVSTKDGFATWSARVVVPDGTSLFRAVARDVAGAELPPLDVSVEFEPVPRSPSQIALDPKRQQVLANASSFLPFGAVALDLSEGRWIVVSGPDRGTGPAVEEFSGFTVDAAKDLAYGFTNFPFRVVRVDLATGDRTTISDETSAGPVFTFPSDVEFDAARGRLLAADPTDDAIYAVDLGDGSRSIFSDATHGTGPAFDRPEGVMVVEAQGRLLVVDDSLDALLSVDLSTGDRSIVSDFGRGSGPAFDRPIAVSFDPASGGALVLDGRLEALLRVNLLTGDRAIVTDRSRAGVAFEILSDVASRFDASGRALLSDPVGGRILAVDLASGAFEDLGRVHVGEATPLGQVNAFTVDPATGHLFVTKGAEVAALLEIDPATGRRTVVSSAGRGSGDLFTFANAVAISPERRTAYVGDVNELAEVDLATGNRSLLSGSGAGSGPDIDSIVDLAIDEELGAALVVGGVGVDATMLSVDLVTGDRTEVSGPTRGNGETFKLPMAIALDPDGITAYVSDRSQGALVRVDRVSGDREDVSSAAIGGGPPFELITGGLSLDAAGRHAFVCDFRLGIVQVDLVTGDREVVSGPGVGTGPVIEDLGILDAPRGRFFARAHNVVSILAIDLESGDRAMISY